MGTKQLKHPLCAFQVFQMDSEICVCGGARPVSVCVTRATVLTRTNEGAALGLKLSAKMCCENNNYSFLNVAARGVVSADVPRCRRTVYLKCHCSGPFTGAPSEEDLPMCQSGAGSGYRGYQCATDSTGSLIRPTESLVCMGDLMYRQ